MCSQDGPQPRAYLQNLRQPMPMGKKLRLLTKNTWTKVSRVQSCCGHHGEPGC